MSHVRKKKASMDVRHRQQVAYPGSHAPIFGRVVAPHRPQAAVDPGRDQSGSVRSAAVVGGRAADGMFEGPPRVRAEITWPGNSGGCGACATLRVIEANVSCGGTSASGGAGIGATYGVGIEDPNEGIGAGWREGEGIVSGFKEE